MPFYVISHGCVGQWMKLAYLEETDGTGDKQRSISILRLHGIASIFESIRARSLSSSRAQNECVLNDQNNQPLESSVIGNDPKALM